MKTHFPLIRAITGSAIVASLMLGEQALDVEYEANQAKVLNPEK